MTDTRSLAKLVIIGMVVQLAVIAYVVAQNYSQRKGVVVSQRKGCERGKLDRQDNADFQKAQSAYIKKVTAAKSVKEDVKIAAREARITFERTSHSLTLRAKIDCEAAYPKARLFP